MEAEILKAAQTKKQQKPVVLLRDQKGFARFWSTFKRDWMLHLMILGGLTYYILFEFVPLYGTQIAFRNYRVRAGIWGSEWVGLKNFQEFFLTYRWKEIVWNTFILSMYSIAVGFPIPIILALFLHVSSRKVLKSLAQNISYIPHFISVVVMVGLMFQLMNPVTGLLATACKALGIQLKGDIRYANNTFRHLYTWSGVWQNMGWSTIMYVAALAGVSMELHEAAKLDGASRFRRIFCVDLPAIAPTIAIMLILRFGSVLSVGRDKVYLMQNSLNIERSEVISTYVYKYGLANGRTSFGTAVGLMNSAINSFMIIFVNLIANWVSDGEAGLF